MLRFLSGLFSPATPPTEGPDPALIDAAIERTVDGTDRRLRALGDYRKRLRQPVEKAVRHVISLVDSLPDPVEVSRQAYGTDLRMRAFFASADHLREVLGGFQNVRAYLEDRPGPPPENVFGLLTMEREERTVLGMELEGDTLRRDVLQVAVNFFHHRYLGAADSEADTRRQLKIRAFDFLVERALEHLAGARKKRTDLDHQRFLLRRKLEAMQAGNWGLAPMLADTERNPRDLAELEAEIAAIDAELGRSGCNALGLEQSLQYVRDTLGRPMDWLAVRPVLLRLDYRGIKLAESTSAHAPELALSELYSGTGQHRIVVLGRVPYPEIPERPDFLRAARHYLR